MKLWNKFFRVNILIFVIECKNFIFKNLSHFQTTKTNSTISRRNNDEIKFPNYTITTAYSYTYPVPIECLAPGTNKPGFPVKYRKTSRARTSATRRNFDFIDFAR